MLQGLAMFRPRAHPLIVNYLDGNIYVDFSNHIRTIPLGGELASSLM